LEMADQPQSFQTLKYTPEAGDQSELKTLPRTSVTLQSGS
jgi:hypothetical protein